MASAVTSIYNNVISAASAGFAPTNSADVSAIASAYQVVSATATQLYAGTAYVTSVNEAPISASRAGNAANASMATSAYYDGTGRLISSLPDNAAVSAIASSYAESAASSKQDTLTFGYDTSDKISSINGSSLAGEGGGGGIDSATCSAIASAYAESAVSSVSGNYYTTANESGYALSADVSGTVDLVSTQSANWGGSALQLSAGPGISLTLSGNTLVASTDGYVWNSASLYYNASPEMNTSYVLSDYCSAYDLLEVDFYDANTWRMQMQCPIPTNLEASGTRGGYFNAVASDSTTAASVWFKCFRWSAIGSNWYCQVDELAGAGGSTNQVINANQGINPPKVLQIVGWKRGGINA